MARGGRVEDAGVATFLTFFFAAAWATAMPVGSGAFGSKPLRCGKHFSGSLMSLSCFATCAQINQ